MGRFRPTIDDYDEESDDDDVDKTNSQQALVPSSARPDEPLSCAQSMECFGVAATHGFVQHPHINGHIIYPRDFYYPRPPRRAISFWWWIALAAISAHFVARYGPPAPPKRHDQDLDWGGFLDLEITRLWNASTALLSTIPYVGRWCWQGLYDDFAEFFQLPPCSMKLPESIRWNFVVGQPAARSVLSDAFDAWDQSGPLLLLHSGTIGVGKLETARQFAKIVFQHCNTDPQMEILLISGDDYTKGSDQDPTAIIYQYAKKRPKGGVIILHHIEQFSSLILGSCLKSIRQLKSTMIVFTTTYTGSKTIHKSLKQTIPMSRLELDLSLRHEIDVELEADLTQYFHAVAPFVPLGPRELQLILFDKVKEWSNRNSWSQLRMSATLAEALTDSSLVDYLVVRNKDQDMLVFSGHGAKVLTEKSPLYNKLVAQINRCFGRKGHPEHIADMDYDTETDEALFRWCTSDGPDQVCDEACRFYLVD